MTTQINILEKLSENFEELKNGKTLEKNDKRNKIMTF